MSKNNAVSDAVKKLIAEALQGFADRHPDGPIKKVSLADVDIRDTLVSLVQPRANLLADLEKRARDGQVPLGVLSSAAGRPLAVALLQRAIGHIYAGTDDPEAYEYELDSARDAFGRFVVADTSAVYVSMLSGHENDLKRKFRSIVIPQAVSRDIEDGYRDVVGVLKSGLSIGYDPASSTLRITEETDAELSRMSERAGALKDHAETFERVEVDRYDLLRAFDHRQNRVWVEPVEYAGQSGATLYSDDVPLRALARSLSIPTFGTLALLDVLIGTESIADVTVEILESFMREYVVDLPSKLEDLLGVAAEENFRPGAASYALSRRSMWQDSDASQESFMLLRQVHESAPSENEAWLVSALLGASAARPGSNIVGLMASFWFTRVSAFDEDAYALALRAARAVARDRVLPDPKPDLDSGINMALSTPESPNWMPNLDSRNEFLGRLGVVD